MNKMQKLGILITTGCMSIGCLGMIVVFIIAGLAV